MRTTWIRVLTVLTALGITAAAMAETHVSGNISGHWVVGRAPYFVDAHVTVPSNDSLIIDPGVTVIASGNYHFNVNGYIIAVGTLRDSVRFRASNNTPGAWFGLTLTGAIASDSHFKYALIKHAYQAIKCVNSDPVIENTAITNSTDAGVIFSGSAGRLQNSSIISVPQNDGVLISDRSTAQVLNCIINDVGYGVAISSGAHPRVEGCRITNVSDHGFNVNGAAVFTRLIDNVVLSPGVRGISISQSDGVTIERCVIYRAGTAGVFFYRSNGGTVLNSTIIGCGQYGVQFGNNNGGEVRNCILGENTRSGVGVSLSGPIIDYNDLYSNGNGDYSGIEPGINDIHEAPNLVNPGAGNFHPNAGSPVIDAGDPESNHDPDGTRADIGAIFFNQNLPPVISSPSPDTNAVLNGDSAVTFTAEVTDPNDNPTVRSWFVNGVEELRGSDTFTRTFRYDGDYWVRLQADDGLYAGVSYFDWNVTVVGSYVRFGNGLPNGYTISEVYPNPVNGSARIDITLPISSTTKIKVVGLDGREVSSTGELKLNAGSHSLRILDHPIPSGSYNIIVEMAGRRIVRSMVHLR